MRPERALIAERPLARHAPGLLRDRAGAGDDALPQLALACERLTRTLAAGLGRFLGTEVAMVTSSAPQGGTMAELSAGTATLASNSLLAVGARAAPLLASLEAKVVLRLVDRAYGGQGKVSSIMPRAFPVSAELLIERLEGVIAAALAAAFGLAAPDEPAVPPIRTLRRDASLAQVTPFAATEPLTRLVLTVYEALGDEWTVTLAFPAATLEALLAPGGMESPARPRGGARMPALTAADTASTALATPFADMPLTLRAVLVDMPIPLSRLSNLAVGDVLPVAVARSVPLELGGRTVAHGTIGALDDRVAVQLTHAFT